MCGITKHISVADFYFTSSENYERLEADKKKQVHKKRRFEGPTIRYHSVLMPLVSNPVLKEENVDVEGYVETRCYLVFLLILFWSNLLLKH